MLLSPQTHCLHQPDVKSSVTSSAVVKTTLLWAKSRKIFEGINSHFQVMNLIKFWRGVLCEDLHKQHSVIINF